MYYDRHGSAIHEQHPSCAIAAAVGGVFLQPANQSAAN